jgi:hypothetical protein
VSAVAAQIARDEFLPMKISNNWRVQLLCLLSVQVIAGFAIAQEGGCDFSTSITTNFNGTKIPAGSYLWLTSVLKPSALPAHSVTFYFFNQTVSWGGNNSNTIPVPDAQVTFDPSATAATTVFDGSEWITTVPSSGVAGNTFIAGAEWQLPQSLPGGIKNVTWSGNVFSDTPNVAFQWQWAGAVYTFLSSDYNNLAVKPVDDTKASIYKNADHAGTPENYKTAPESSKSNVIGGATGGGASNYTGSYSGTGIVRPCAGE